MLFGLSQTRLNSVKSGTIDQSQQVLWEKQMFYGEIKEGDVLEWQTFGGQSTPILIVKAGEIVTYGSGKGKDKKIRPAFYIRSLHAFDDEPELVDAAHLKQNCKLAAATRQTTEDAAAFGDGPALDTDFSGSSQTE